MIEDELLFTISKLIAESDSIGEQYCYCRQYTREIFEEEKIELIGNPYNTNYQPRNYVELAREIIKVVQSCSV